MMAAAQDGLEQRQRRRLAASRAVATGMLVVSAAIFAATLTLHQPGHAVLLLRAVAEASLVGGLADWFAVTALFRRPLGLPIPHTAILPANKDRIGEGLARFLDRYFLAPELLVAELRSLDLAERVAAWLADRRHAALLADELTKALPFFLSAVGDRQLMAFLGRALGPQLRAAQLGPVLAQILRVLASTGYHEAVLDAALAQASEFLSGNQDAMLAAVAERRRRWIPRAVTREIARAMLRAAGQLIEDLQRPDGEARQALIAKIDEFAADLETSQGLGVGAALARPEVRSWIAASWERLRGLVLADLDASASRTRRALAMMILSLGDALQGDAAMRERLDQTLEAVVVEALPWRAELVRFVEEVVRRWQPDEFTSRIETAVGADLQYIRMNGALVGGLVGGGLYLLTWLAG
jgi:uncharacterized membrane-anchored protein YjiN (DUF445 family)